MLFFILEIKQPVISGEIFKITISEIQTTIYLTNHSEKIIFYNISKINLKEKNKIIVYGKKETFQNKTVIFADKIKNDS